MTVTKEKNTIPNILDNSLDQASKTGFSYQKTLDDISFEIEKAFDAHEPIEKTITWMIEHEHFDKVENYPEVKCFLATPEGQTLVKKYSLFQNEKISVQNKSPEHHIILPKFSSTLNKAAFYLLTLLTLQGAVSCNNKKEQLFDKKHYLDISGKVIAPYMERQMLFEELPTVYDNILYAKEISDKHSVEETVVYEVCQRMQGLENHINMYAAKYDIPADKLLGLIFLESEGKPNVGNKSLYSAYNCYGYTQLSVLVGKKYGAIKKDKKGRLKDYRDNIDVALNATCKFLSEIHNKYIKSGYQDENRSLTFASYHMGETHMHKILDIAKRKTGHSPSTMQDLIEINDEKLGSEFMDLKDESYKYYPKLLAAGRIYLLYKNNRSKFNKNIERFLNLPIRRTPSLAEEYPWYGNDIHYDDSTDMVDGLESNKLFGLSESNGDLNIDKKIGENSQSPREKELMKMTSKASWGLIKFLTYYYPFDIKLTSLTRSDEYNGKIYKTKKKRTSHATGHALDLGFPRTAEQKRYLKRILYGLEAQGKIAFITEGDHFHLIINPKYKKYFEKIVDTNISEDEEECHK